MSEKPDPNLWMVTFHSYTGHAMFQACFLTEASAARCFAAAHAASAERSPVVQFAITDDFKTSFSINLRNHGIEMNSHKALLVRHYAQQAAHEEYSPKQTAGFER